MNRLASLRRVVAGTVLCGALALADDAAAATKQEILKKLREQAPALLEKHRGEVRARTAQLQKRYQRTREAVLARRAAARADRRRVARGEATTAPRRVEQEFHSGGTAAVEPLPLNPLLDPFGFLDDETGESFPVGVGHRIAFYDFDGDGDIDVFVGDKYYGDEDDYAVIRYFENVGSVIEPEFEERFGEDNPFDGLQFAAVESSPGLAGVAPFLVNIDGDPEPEAFVGTYDEGVVFLQLQGDDFVRDDANNPLTTVLDAIEDGLGEDLRFTVPHLVDIDGDGDLDAFVGTKAHGVLFLRDERALPTDPPNFVDRTNDASNPFFGSDYPQLGFTAPFFADVDGDGDLDGFLGTNFYVATPIGLVRYFENDYGTFIERVEPGPHPLLGNIFTLPQPAFADLDDDGDLDAFVAGKPYITMSFENTGENTGEADYPAFLTSANGIEFFDYDGDQDFDAFVDLGKLGVGYFENTGTANEPRWEIRTGAQNPFSTFNDFFANLLESEKALPLGVRPVVGDIDNDGVPEAFVGIYGLKDVLGRGEGVEEGVLAGPETIPGTLFFLERDLSGQFQLADAPLPLPFLADEDPDVGLFDGLPDPHLADFDGDGDLDLVVGSKISEEDGQGGTTDRAAVFFFQNQGLNSGTFTLVNTLGDDEPAEDVLASLELASAFLADVDGDGDLDLFVGGTKYAFDGGCYCEYATTLLFLNQGDAQNPSFDLANPIEVETFTGLLPTPALVDINGDDDLDFFLGGKFSAQHFVTEGLVLDAASEIPTLSQWMLGALSGLLGLFGLGVLRRRL